MEINNKIKNYDCLTLINFIKSYIDIFIDINVNEKIKEYQKQNNSQTDYESVLIKYENDIRGHIRNEHQLKIYIESLQNEIEEKEFEKNILYEKIATLNNNLKNKNIKENKRIEEEIDLLKKELSNKDILLKSYENQNLILSSNEKKLKALLKKKEKTFLEYEEKYIKQIQEINKNLHFYKDKLNKKYNSSSINLNEYNNNPSPSSTLREEKLNLNSINNSNRHKKRNNNISFLSISRLSYSHNKIRNFSNKNFKKENNSSSTSLILSKKQKAFLSRLFINYTINLSNKKKKKIHNRFKSFENSSRATKIKKSSIFKDFIINSNTVKHQINNYRNHLKNSSQGKINNIEFINNINLFTNSVKNGKYNIFRDISGNKSNKNKNISKNLLNNSQRNNNKSKVKGNSLNKY